MDRRDEDTPSTPVTRPGNPRASSSDERDGVPCYAESDDTGKVSQALCSAMQDRDDTVTPETLLDVLVEKLSNANGNGDDPKKHADSIRAHNRLAVFMAILLGPGGALAIVYATSDRSKSNAYEVEHLKKMEPRIEKTEKEVRFIRVRVDGIDKSMNHIETSNIAIAAGIEDLKKENVNRVQDELVEAKKEIRRLERRNRER